jgi:hypothetical protein
MRTWRSPFQTREGNRILWPLSIFKIVIRPELMLISWTHPDLSRTFHTNLKLSLLMRTVITFLILLSRTWALYICYSVDVTSEEILPEKCTYYEEPSVKDIRIPGADLRGTTSGEIQFPALTVLSNRVLYSNRKRLHG